jgi:hypothetical protein
MIDLDFYEEVENSLDQLLKFDSDKQHESPTNDEENYDPLPLPTICVTSAEPPPATSDSLTPYLPLP